MTRRLPPALALCVVVVLGVNVSVVAARNGRPPAASMGQPSAAPTPSRSPVAPSPSPSPPPPPARVVFSVSAAFPDSGNTKEPALQMMSALPDGTGVRKIAARPAVRVVQENPAADLVVDVEVLDFDAKHFDNCGFAGCSSSTSTSTEQGIVLQRISTGARRVVTRGGYDSDPVWSPDGSLIAYARLEADEGGVNGRRTVIGLLDADGNELGLAFEPPRRGSDTAPVWSPDGESILVVRHDDSVSPGTTSLAVVHPDGQPVRILATGRLGAASWSPDGRTIAFARSRANHLHGLDLWLIDVRTGGLRQVTRPAFGPVSPSTSPCGDLGRSIPYVASTSWSPDSRSVAFVSSWPHRRQYGSQTDVLTYDTRTGRLATVYATPRAACHGSVQHRRITALYGWVQ